MMQDVENSVEIDTTYGEWIYDESIREYVWIENEKPIPDDPHYISVLEYQHKYVIIVDKEPRDSSINTYKCENINEVLIVLRSYKAGYSVTGKLIKVESCLPEIG